MTELCITFFFLFIQNYYIFDAILKIYKAFINYVSINNI